MKSELVEHGGAFTAQSQGAWVEVTAGLGSARMPELASGVLNKSLAELIGHHGAALRAGNVDRHAGLEPGRDLQPFLDSLQQLRNVPQANPRATLLAMSDNTASVDVSLGRQGRLVIPASLRRSLGLEEGDRLVARQEADRLVIEKPEQIKQRLKERFAQVPAERGLVDELIADRREESRREGEG